MNRFSSSPLSEEERDILLNGAFIMYSEEDRLEAARLLTAMQKAFAPPVEMACYEPIDDEREANAKSFWRVLVGVVVGVILMGSLFLVDRIVRWAADFLL